MKYAASELSRRGSRTFIPAFVTLALWRLRQTWRLLLVTGIGILAAVVLACTGPLFSAVALNAGLHDVLTATPDDSQLLLQAVPTLLSTNDMLEAKALLSGAMQSQLGSYLTSDNQLMLQTADIPLVSSDPALQSSEMELTGVSIPQATPHLRLLQGRLPAASGSNVEIALTAPAASALHVSVGATLTLKLSLRIEDAATRKDIPLTYPLPMQVAGIIASPGSDPFWHGNDFQPSTDISREVSIFKAVMSTDAFMASLTAVAQQYGGSEVLLLNSSTILWYFSLDVSHISMDTLNDLITQLNATKLQIEEQFNPVANSFGGLSAGQPSITAQLSGPTLEQDNAPSSLERYRDRAGLVQLPVAILTIQIVALLLFFVSLTTSLLIERQSEVIALLRSRGARRRQVFGTFTLQGLGLGLVALLAGPGLALLLAWFLGHLILASSEQGALTTTLGDPLQAMLRVGWFAAAAVGVAMLALFLAVGGAARRDVLAIRREAARSTHRPIWQRLSLDIGAAIIACTGSGVSFYLAHSGTLDARTAQLLAAPLDLIGPFFLLVAGALLALRLFPLLLGLLARGAQRRPGAPLLLALAQMSRSPQAALRLILLLSLTIAFAGFSLVFTASEQQRIVTVAGQQVGADFSGVLQPPAFASLPPTPGTLARQYAALPGVLSASAGYTAGASLASTTLNFSLEVQGVDTRTFAQTALWTSQDADQPLSALLPQLSAPNYLARNAVPAVVDAVAWNRLHLAPGTIFTLSLADIPFGLPFIAVAEVQHLPGINDSLATSGTGDYSTPGGLLADFDILSLFYKIATQSQQPLAPNHLWLRTSSDPASLARVRAALTSGALHLTTFQDRQALIDQMQRDPLYRALTSVLWLGTVTTLLLALVGTLLSSWLNVRARLTTFALLRALGSAPRQIASVLAWEQGIVYTVAIALGSLFGALLVVSAVPGLVFANPDSAANPISSGEFYVIQQVLPAQIVLPATLGIAGALLVAICAAALVMMARVVSTPSISQALRLNED